jgi:hypothetical protein
MQVLADDRVIGRGNDCGKDELILIHGVGHRATVANLMTSAQPAACHGVISGWSRKTVRLSHRNGASRRRPANGALGVLAQVLTSAAPSGDEATAPHRNRRRWLPSDGPR